MSYEVEAIVPNSPGIPASIPTVMREERTIDPYRQTRLPKPAAPASGQQDIGGKAALSEESALTEEKVQLSPQVAALARKEQRFRAQQQELEKERAVIAAEKAEFAQLKAMKEKLAAKDYSGLDGLVDYNEYSQYQVNKLNAADPAQDAIRKLTEEVSSLKKSQEDNINKQFEAAVAERKIAVQQLVQKNPEFAKIKKAGREDAVVHHILDTWENDSKEISVEQAAREVQEIIIEQAKRAAALLEEETEASVPEEKKPLPPLKQSLKTLTNQVTAGDLKRPLKPLSQMNESERYAEARRRAEAKLQAAIKA